MATTPIGGKFEILAIESTEYRRARALLATKTGFRGGSPLPNGSISFSFRSHICFAKYPAVSWSDTDCLFWVNLGPSAVYAE
jgi:hypothetical protein